jgi:PAS domain S-box-containing protein
MPPTDSASRALRTVPHVTAARPRDDAHEPSLASRLAAGDRARRILEHAADGVLVHRLDGHVLEANRSALAMLGLDGADLATLRVSDLLAYGSTPARAVPGSSPPAAHVTAQQVELRRRDGTTFDAELRSSCLEIAGESVFVTLVRDVTERAAMLRRLEHQAEALVMTNQELRRVVAVRDEFVANMSHELRTPLAAVLGVTEGLLEGAHGPLAPEHAAHLETVVASGRHLLELINDILHFARLESSAQELALELVELDEVCEAALQAATARATQRRIRLQLSSDRAVRCVSADRARLLELLGHLLSNAIKFTDPGGAVSLEVRGSPTFGEVTLSVVDTGDGIAPEDQIRLFEPFFQVDGSLARRHEGSGLGLAIVARLVDLHGGRVAVSSRVGFGSRFDVTLPIGAPGGPDARGGGPALSTRGVRPGMRILLADDNDTVAALMRDVFEANGLEMTAAHGVREVVERALEAKADVVLVDVGDVEDEGLATIRALRATPETSALPVVALTSPGRAAADATCLGAGACTTVHKPISFAEIFRVLGRYVG